MGKRKSSYREFNRDLAFKLRCIREYLGLTLDEAGAKFGVANNTVAYYEGGSETVNLLYLKAATSACGMTLDDLFLPRNDFIKKLYYS